MSWLVLAQSLSDNLSQYSVRVLLGGILAIFAILVIASGIHNRYHFTKKAFYTVISAIILSATAALTLINIELIAGSEDGSITRLDGKLAVFACGQEIPILPSSSLLNKSSGDSRHRIFPNGDLEFLGYRTSPETDGTLGSFFRSIGGSLSSNVIALPFNEATEKNIVNNVSLAKFVKTNPVGEKYLELRSGESCDTTPSMVNVFIYEYRPTVHNYSQQRVIITPEQFLLNSNPFSEPDCVVIVYGEPTSKTDLTCKGYPDANKIDVEFPGDTN